MRNCLSRKVAHAGLQGNNLDPIDIIKNLHLTFYWQNKSLLMWFTAADLNRVKTS